jgi:RNA polymerase sigma-70 factor (ECF subfamily)
MTHSVEALRRGDSAAWDAFYREHLREVYGFLFRLVRCERPAADDLFQETWLEALDGIAQFDPQRGELRAWLFGIARRRVALYWRRRLNAGRCESEGLAEAASNGAVLPQEAIEQVEQAAAVRAALLVLSPERRRVLMEKYVEEMTVAQIAAGSGKSFKAVESLLARAREELRSLLAWEMASSTKGEAT